jgi:putative addiction module component (TIGR02574 family)
MSTTTTPQPAETELTPELLERVMKLSQENRDKLISLLTGEPPIPGPSPVGDWEYWKAEINRRIEDIESGRVKALSHEEAMAVIRKAREERGS